MASNKLQIFLDLMQIVENGFIFKLKQKNPDISQKEIIELVNQWYLARPELGFDNPDCEKGDISRFRK